MLVVIDDGAMALGKAFLAGLDDLESRVDGDGDLGELLLSEVPACGVDEFETVKTVVLRLDGQANGRFGGH
jgi:hypothetical protein